MMKNLSLSKNLISFLVAGVVLLAALGLPSAVAAQSSCGAAYVVKPGDYLTKIARTCGVSYSDLLRANPTITNPGLIFTGRVIYIPARIQFAAGATAVNVQGQLKTKSQQVYLLNAGAHQMLDVTVTAPSGVTLAIYGADGSTIKSANSILAFRGVLPKSQDYRLVIASGASAADYGMSVAIPARIRFSTGSTSTSFTGTVPTNLGQFYILHAGKGQTLNVTATPQFKLQLIVYGVDGSVLKSGMGEGTSFSGVLPSTQDYILVLKSVNPAQSYTLNVSIPAAPPIPVTGTNSYTVQKGDTLFSIAVRYHTTVTVLLRANPDITNKNVLSVGQVIYLPGATLKLSNGQIVYIAKSGDSMIAIARQFNTTLTTLITANEQIRNPNLIYTGQRINIP